MSGCDLLDFGKPARQNSTCLPCERLMDENDKLRMLFTDFWTWADPPFALDSGTFEQFMEIVEQARELGFEV